MEERRVSGFDTGDPANLRNLQALFGMVGVAAGVAEPVFVFEVAAVAVAGGEVLHVGDHAARRP